MPFIKEYFGNDPLAKEIFENKSRNEMVPRPNNINNNNINNNNNNQSNRNLNEQNLGNNNNNRIINNLNNNANILNHNEIYLNIIADNSNNKFILLFNPNKFICFILLFLNIVISGLGTFIIGIKNCCLYNFILGIIQFFGFFGSILESFKIKNSFYFLRYKVNSFLYIYLIIIAILFYLSSIYVGIFHNFLFFNPRTTNINENKQKGIGIILLNLISGGLGTLLYGFLVKDDDCFNRMKIWLIGIVQISGFAILILAFSLIGNIHKIILIIFFFIGAMGYLTSIIIGVRCYRRILVS